VVTLATLLLISIPFKLEIPATIAFWSGLLHWVPPTTLAFRSIIRPVLGIALSLSLDFAWLWTKDEIGWLRWPQIVRTVLLAAALLLLFLATRQQTAAPFIYQKF
jgi:hypothetical protein